MDFELTEDQSFIQEAARDFADNVLLPDAAGIDREERFPEERWRQLAELGYLGFLIPEAYGGAGLGPLAVALVLAELSRACAATGFNVAVENLLVAGPLSAFGSEEQKSRYLPRLASGELIGAGALLEHERGSDSSAVETVAERKGGSFVINGRKAWVPCGGRAGLILVLASADSSRGPQGLGVFLVEGGSAGLSARPGARKIGLRGVEVVELVFEEVVVPADNVLGGVGRGFEIARDALDGSCIGVAAQAAGILAACLADSVKYARERQQFGKPIAQFYPIQHAIAGMAADLEVSRLLTLKAAWLRGAGKPHSQEAAMAKLFATEAADRGATKAVQVHGGAGYLKDFAVERYYRDAKMMGALDGTSDGERLRVGREILGV